jgi:DNA-binding SARP family transcriptional activator
VTFSVQVIGGWALFGSDGKVCHVRTPVARLIAFLAVRGRVQPRAYVAGTLWPDRCEQRAGANLRSTLWRARTEVAGVVDADASTVWLCDGVKVDLDLAMAAIRSALIGTRSVGAPVQSLAADVLPDWDEDWVWPTRFLYRQLRLQVLDGERLEPLAEVRTDRRRIGDTTASTLNER